jgi:hypothetical protein
MSFNGGAWTKPVILFDHVTSCQFNYFGRADTPGSPVADDTDGNGFFNQAELDLMDGVADGTLDQFEETRWISGIDYRFDILTNTGAAPYVVSGKVSPRLMEAKGKFFR